MPGSTPSASDSYDPYDFWATALGGRAKRLYYHHRFFGSLAVLPFVVLDTFAPSSRRLVSTPRRFPMSDAHYALAFFAMANVLGSRGAVERGECFLAELSRSRSPGFEEFCWGLPFDWKSRGRRIAAGTPLITVVPYAYEAFEAGYEATGALRYLDTMESIARFAHREIPVTELEGRAAAAAYSPFDRTRVVNASAYRAYLLASAGRRFERDGWSGDAQRNVAFVLDSQRPDGSWSYADASEDFVDNFHTCLVLKNLVKVWRINRTLVDVLAAVCRGFAFYRRSLLDEGLQPFLFAVRPRVSFHKRDLYDYAEGINLSRLLLGIDPEARRILNALVTGLQDGWMLPDGHFVTRKHVVGRLILPHHRWGQSQVFHALVQLSGIEG